MESDWVEVASGRGLIYAHPKPIKFKIPLKVCFNDDFTTIVFFFSRLILGGTSNPISYHITYILTYILYPTSYNYCRRAQTVVVVVMFVDDEEGDVAVIVRYIPR